jgi:hypothetical protein
MLTNKKGDTSVKPFDIENKIRSLIPFGYSKDDIKRALAKNLDDSILIDESVERVCDDYPDYDLIQFFMDSKIILDKDAEEEKYYMFNLRKRDIVTINPSRLTGIIDPKLKWSHKKYTCLFEYDPYIPKILHKFDGQWKFNTYKCPFWAEDFFYSGGKKAIPVVKKIPKLYHTFFMHLVNDHKESYTYLIDWLSNMLQNRNYCILTTIGNQGIGKGVLGSIMQNLVGKSNFSKTDKKLITKDFNGQLKDKRLVYLDELKVTSVDQENKLKDLINDYIEVEAKGVDAKLSRNYSSLYFSSNNLDSIRIPSDDRRFSIVELTDKKLVSVFDENKIGSLLEPENIEQLAFFLFTREVDKNKMMSVFRSNRTEVIRSASLNVWQEWFIEEYCYSNKGKEVTVKDASFEVESEFGSRCRPGRGAFQTLSAMYPESFKVKKLLDGDRQVWKLIILGE